MREARRLVEVGELDLAAVRADVALIRARGFDRGQDLDAALDVVVGAIERNRTRVARSSRARPGREAITRRRAAPCRLRRALAVASSGADEVREVGVGGKVDAGEDVGEILDRVHPAADSRDDEGVEKCELLASIFAVRKEGVLPAESDDSDRILRAVVVERPPEALSTCGDGDRAGEERTQRGSRGRDEERVGKR